MILYNASTSNGLRNFARRYSNTNSTTFSDADCDASLNAWYDVFVTHILEAMDDWDFNGEIATASLVANQQEYTFPTDILKVKRIEVSYDGTNWYEVTRFDVNERSRANTQTAINNEFSTSDPFGDVFDGSVFLYPVPTSNVTNGLKIWYEKLPTALSSATDEPIIARPFHIGLARGAAKDYLEQHIEVTGAQARLAQQDMEIEKLIPKMQRHYSKRNQDRQYAIIPGFVDYGYDYN